MKIKTDIVKVQIHIDLEIITPSMGSKHVTLNTDIVESDIPLLLSKKP